ncbi:MAG TPA: amidohydrolase [Candidatus Limnocylindria bacterium]
MSSPRAELLVRGQVVVRAEATGVETAGAIGIASGRVVSVGSWDEVSAGAAPGAPVLDSGGSAVVPGLHDFHIHLVGLARSRGEVLLDDAPDAAEVTRRLLERSRTLSREEWLRGRGWSEAQMAGLDTTELGNAIGGRPAFITSHDGHSAWVSPAVLGRAGITADTPDPSGGRIERDASGSPTGVLRETAMDLVSDLVPELQGEALRASMDATLRELARLGITGASEAGDYTAEGGIGADAAFGDSYSTLTDLGDLVDGRLRLSLGIPVDAIPVAAERGLRTGAALLGRRTMRFGWAKEFADGALGSGTAALFEPSTSGQGDVGILRVTAEDLDRLFELARSAGIGLAIHAIGDRAATTVLDALARAPARAAGVPDDRMEHVQLLRAGEAARLAILRMTASIQPIHAAADRDLVEACWDGRQEGAYAWRSLAAAGARLAAGSDAPVESVDPWLGLFAAVHRRVPDDDRGDWRASQALTPVEALAAYTTGPATAVGATDEGHLRVGARADLAVLDVDLDTILAADERLARVRSVATLVDGVEVPLT